MKLVEIPEEYLNKLITHGEIVSIEGNDYEVILLPVDAIKTEGNYLVRHHGRLSLAGSASAIVFNKGVVEIRENATAVAYKGAFVDAYNYGKGFAYNEGIVTAFGKDASGTAYYKGKAIAIKGAEARAYEGGKAIAYEESQAVIGDLNSTAEVYNGGVIIDTSKP